MNERARPRKATGGRIAGAAIALLFLVSCAHSPGHVPRVIILGIDGMDPNFVEAHWSDLPNLAAVRREGEFKRLGTSFPPQSPVAWATFMTGAGPNVHGIYDFVHRNPRTLQPFSSMGETIPPRHVIPLGAWQIPLSSPRVETFRRGRPFWDTLTAHGIPVTILRMPMNYPPVEDDGESLSGMGVPDMQGTFGTFSFYTDDPATVTHDVPGGRIVSTRIEGNRARLRIYGPPNPFRRDGAMSFVDLAVDLDPTAPVARLTLGEQQFILRQGEWSGWIEAKFPLIAGLRSAHGMFRVYARQLAPGFEVYVSPVNIDPERPEVRISSPASYSRRLADAAGLYYTQGMPEDTAALRQHVFDRADYLEQSHIVSHEQIAIFREALKQFHGGLLFFHFYGVDQDSHMLWGKFEGDLLTTYKMVDDLVGWVRPREKNATLIVMSDHGFARFDRAVNLNTWLKSEGFDAYSIGLNSVYLNLQGREAHGAVARDDAPELARQIEARLLAWRDPENGKPVVTAVWRPHPGFHGDIEYAPDLVVGFAPGYRASWDGALGTVGKQAIEDNRDEWIGDHCMDPRAVPGVLIENRRSRAPEPDLQSLANSIPALFGLEETGGMY